MSVPFAYNPPDYEAEKASNSYLMSLVGLLAGLPLPIINLIATFIFFAANRRGPYFVRWHATQALLSQISLLSINSVAFWWTLSILFSDQTVTNNYLAYMFTVGLFNIAEFVATIYAAIATRKGKHVEWWFFGTLTHVLCKPKP
jgi:uncharacterized Tic20 family protein